MGIQKHDVEKIAKLARLELSPDEVELYQGQLVKILDSMAELCKLDTASVPPTTSVLGASNVFREDEPRPFPEPEKLLANAPEREGPYFKVRKVIE
ncbi:MAG: Asp-tRNA(Asn)/Glu-tRNA(Gln) amidotransferase subunit GatC [Elusimicrobia bacterium]|nr:Asp-tRNA(Asn)/Glu-tRNA(Gln) amidotransferase subunit GatC [Elusimicrobiota bacterium]